MKHYALIGQKLGHSYSKVIHEYLFNNNGIDADYALIEVEEENIKDIIEMLRDGRLDGINVTIPYKEKIIPYLDCLDENAKSIGACNTVKVENGKLIGYNTDYLGFIQGLKYQGIKVVRKKVFVLGSGGASKAVCHALRLLKANPIVVSRKGPFDYNMLAKRRHNSIIVNTTPVGMWPRVNERPLSKDVINKTDIIVDIIFNPRQTLLLETKGQNNNGLPMLIYQAAKSEEIWLGQNIEFIFEALRGVLENE